jgi:hypothetical protein
MRVETNSLGTSVADKASFLSRFFYKLLEIMGAAVATAVSGYLVAHLGGFLPPRTQAPATVAVAPSERAVPKTVPANAPPSQPASPQGTQSAALPETGEQRTAQPQPDTTGSAVQGARKTANANANGKATTPVPAPTQATASARKRGKSDKAETAATDASRPRDAAEAKPREGEDEASVEARVRAALANVDANRPAPADLPLRRGDGQGAAGQPRPAEGPSGTTAAIPSRPLDQPPASGGQGVQPRSADVGSQVQQPVILPAATQSPAAQPTPPAQVAPVQPPPVPQPDALTSVEIKSRPVANIETMPAAEPAPPPQEERGVLSAIKHILPDFRRPAPADEVPRPPAPVGE